MSHEIVTHLPAALRKHAVRDLECETDGQFDLMNACKALDMGKSNCSTKVPLTNAALGALLDVCREWLSSSNGNEVMAAKSVLNLHELDFEPEDPRQRRHGVKMPKSLGSYVATQLTQGFLKDPDLLSELKACTNGDLSFSGRVTFSTLGWLLKFAESHSLNGTGANQRAGRKFVATYTEVYEETGRLVDGYLGKGEGTDQAPAEVIEDQAPEVTEEPIPTAVEGRAWEKDKLFRYVDWSDRPIYFWFGGVVKDGPADPVGALVSITWSESKRGRNLLRDVDSGEIVATVHSSALVWATPVDRSGVEETTVGRGHELADGEDQEPAVEAAPEQAGKSVGPVPENWVFMAENADTLTAQAWWARKVASWGL
ncbi:hypothetical protein [Kitasatospora purpeofusca]|uniref:hypothetical protein n=1 Tax=Kitasatospora purpeofusca TaxID=67352 RepID=UPI00365D8699